MKRLLLIPALAAPMWLFACHQKPAVPDPVTVIREDHAAIPAVPEAPPAKPVAPKKPQPKKHTVKPAVPAPAPRPVEAPVAKPPCVFDFIAPCWPQEPR